jgi:hypothetical protein
MRRFIHLIVVVVVVSAIMVLSASSAFAQSCFDDYNRLTPQGPQAPVGGEISDTATGAAVPGEPESGTDELARTVGLLTDAKRLCP